MENTWIVLWSNFISCGAHEDAIVHGCDGCIGERAAAKVGHGPSMRNADDLDGVVEGPLELYVPGVGRHRAQHVHNFILPHEIYHRFGRFTRRNICKICRTLLTLFFAEVQDHVSYKFIWALERSKNKENN